MSMSADRKRFAPFAFAAADLLIEVSPAGSILFAVGAFRERTGFDPEYFLGRTLDDLLAWHGPNSLRECLSEMEREGRMVPLTVHLRNPRGTPMVLSGMRVPGRPPHYALTIGPMPRFYPPPATAQTGETAVSVDLDGFTQAAEAWLRDNVGGKVGLFEVHNASPRMSVGQRRDQTDPVQAGSIATSLAELAGPGCVTTAVADGRFGVLGRGDMDVAELAEALSEKELGNVTVGSTELDLTLSVGDMPAQQAARALRYALMQYGEAGGPGVIEGGFSAGLAGFIREADSRIRRMEACIRHRRFTLAFQPVVDLGSRRAHHFEALLRPFSDPNLPTRNTATFVTFAEASGLIEELDEAVLEAALRESIRAGAVPVAVNVSSLSMQSVEFCTKMLSMLADAPHMLIELTETAGMESVATVSRALAQLRSAGIGVCLDDFGAGSASFRYLRNFEVDIVKVDGSYVQAATASPRDRELLEGMVRMAHAANAQVIAEMVETEATAALLQDLRVEFGQGWLFGRAGALPMSGLL